MLKASGPSDAAIRALLDDVTERAERMNPDGRQLVVGVPADAGNEDNGLPVAANAYIHEFGIGVPERSFIRAPLNANALKYKKAFEWVAEQCANKKMELDKGLSQIGFMMLADIQKTIEAGIPPPNAPSTIKQKGSDTPLIDTGRLRQSITFRITEAGEEF